MAVVAVVAVVALWLLFDFGGFADFLEGFEERRDVRFGSIIRDGDRLGLQVADNIFDTLLKGYILHDLVATPLTVDVTCEDYHLFVRLGGKRSHHRQ